MKPDWTAGMGPTPAATDSRRFSEECQVSVSSDPTKALKIAQWIMLASMTQDPPSIPGRKSTWYKERINCCRLTSDHHTCAMTHVNVRTACESWCSHSTVSQGSNSVAKLRGKPPLPTEESHQPRLGHLCKVLSGELLLLFRVD